MISTAMSDEPEAASLRQLVSRGWTYHHATFDLYLKLSGVLLTEAGVTGVILPEIRRLVQLERGHSSDDELRVRKANIDLANTGLTDAMLNTLLGAWQTLGISCCSLCLRLQRNCLTGASLLTLGQFVTAEAIGSLEELHATHQLGPERVTRRSVLSFLKKLSQCSKYPIWVKRRRCFRPVHLRLGRCGIENPEEIAGELEKDGARVCFADDQGCIRAACSLARHGGGCPVAHLFDFRSQELPAENPEPLGATERLKEAEQMEVTLQGEKGKLFLCGSCERSLSIDMFTRCQFSKASKIDEHRGESHLVRRCNECVTQPCCACGQHLSLTAFSGSQMLRPQGTRRCRPCTLDTWWCDRCSKPKVTGEFSSFQARKGKQLSKVCRDCEKSNPYFDRRHVLCAIFSGKYAAPPLRLPAFSKEILMSILSFARESKFITISGTSYTCSLCNKTKSFLANAGDDAVERHVRTSQVHAKRVRSLEAGHLVEVATTGLDAGRFRDGLGLRGAFCGIDQVKEAASLIDIWTVNDTQPLLPFLRHVGCRESESGQLRWVSPEQFEKASGLVEAAHGSGIEGDFFASASMQDVAEAEERALQQKRTKVNMLCRSGVGDSDEEEDEETVALRRFLAR
ncbi:unnamed protein product [Effrenium voratum]|uniref:Uncharacterized protein n=1 Tax=Effrenium voratum TaxID=2562239 RepID=A0AA36JSQ4_9DINO|nr:unnamed protein product [Effrenium voratum]CAJ1457718.1 unnamed protein product [Effrenium voratum]